MAKEQFEAKQQLGPVWLDMDRITSFFEETLNFDMDKSGFSAFMAYVLSIKAFALQDTTFLLACDVLTTAWLRVLLSEDMDGYMAQYPNLEAVTRAFVKRHMPYDPAAEDN